jgi:hypothetical protein
VKDISEVVCGFADFGLFVEMARVLGCKYKKVYYCNPSWKSAFPRIQQAKVGSGFDEIEVIDDVYQKINDIDLLVYSDVGQGWEQKYLADNGKAVWGCRVGEELEFYRDSCKELMRELGLPVGNYEVVKGVPALRDYLKEHKDQYVKINKWRGSFETFKAPNYNLVMPLLDQIEHDFGGMKNEMEFVVEDMLKDKFEVAIDAYNIDGIMPKKMLYGVEVKDEAYIAKFVNYEAIPKSLRVFDEKIAPILKKYKYRSFYSPETRIGKDKVPYMIDLCARSPSPPNEVYQIFYENLAEIVWKGANGVCVDPKPKSKWAAEALIHSSWATQHWQPIEFPKEYADRIKLRNGVKIDGKYYTMPQSGLGDLPEIGAVVGYGDTQKAAIDMVKEIAESIEAYYIEVKSDALDKAVDEIETAKEYGVWPVG